MSTYKDFKDWQNLGMLQYNSETNTIIDQTLAQAMKIIALEREVELLKLVTLRKITWKEYESLLTQFESKDDEVLIMAESLLEECKKRQSGMV